MGQLPSFYVIKHGRQWEMPELNGGFNGIVQQAMFDYR
jgi:hypothetical protein